MNDICYLFRIAVKLPDGKTVHEEHKVIEARTKFGEAMATGRVVRFYENLKAQKKIKDFRLES